MRCLEICWSYKEINCALWRCKKIFRNFIDCAGVHYIPYALEDELEVKTTSFGAFFSKMICDFEWLCYVIVMRDVWCLLQYEMDIVFLANHMGYRDFLLCCTCDPYVVDNYLLFGATFWQGFSCLVLVLLGSLFLL